MAHTAVRVNKDVTAMVLFVKILTSAHWNRAPVTTTPTALTATGPIAAVVRKDSLEMASSVKISMSVL